MSLPEFPEADDAWAIKRIRHTFSCMRFPSHNATPHTPCLTIYIRPTIIVYLRPTIPSGTSFKQQSKTNRRVFTYMVYARVNAQRPLYTHKYIIHSGNRRGYGVWRRWRRTWNRFPSEMSPLYSTTHIARLHTHTIAKSRSSSVRRRLNFAYWMQYIYILIRSSNQWIYAAYYNVNVYTLSGRQEVVVSVLKVSLRWSVVDGFAYLVSLHRNARAVVSKRW